MVDGPTVGASFHIAGDQRNPTEMLSESNLETVTQNVTEVIDAAKAILEENNLPAAIDIIRGGYDELFKALAPIARHETRKPAHIIQGMNKLEIDFARKTLLQQANRLIKFTADSNLGTEVGFPISPNYQPLVEGINNGGKGLAVEKVYQIVSPTGRAHSFKLTPTDAPAAGITAGTQGAT